MMQLLISLFSVAGSAGFGSFLKLLSGIMAGRRERRLAEIAAMSSNAKAFQAVFAPLAQSTGSMLTRRILAVMLVSVIAFIGVYSVTRAAEPFVTFVIPEARQGWGLLWGLVRFPAGKETTVELTLGHLALMTVNICALAVGFYFTPNGRR